MDISHRNPSCFSRNGKFLALNFLMLCISITCLAASLFLNYKRLYILNWALREVSSPSPLLNSINVKVFPKKSDTTLLLGPAPSIYRQELSREVDIAWDRLGDLRLIPLSRKEVEALGKNPEHVVRFPPEFGIGNDQYAGRLEVFHQIHCLDSLRRDAYFEHYYGEIYPGGYNETTEMHRLHLSHCIEYLLQGILCQASTNVYTHMWTDALDHAFPDFSGQQKCRDFDAIKEWHEENAVDMENFVKLRAPPGAYVHKMTKEFKKLQGWFKKHKDTGDHGSEIA